MSTGPTLGRVAESTAARGALILDTSVAELDFWVEPVTVSTRSDGRVAVDVRQGARNQTGEVVGKRRVLYVYELRDGLVARMDVEEPAAAN